MSMFYSILIQLRTTKNEQICCHLNQVGRPLGDTTWSWNVKHSNWAVFFYLKYKKPA